MVKDVAEKNGAHANFYQSLTEEETMLLTLRDELYGNSWERMETDLRDRLQGRPYIFKLVNRIEEDLERIQKLRSYEEEHGIDLADYA
jgi:hypothetical protein